MKTLKWLLIATTSMLVLGCADSHSLNVTQDDTNIKFASNNAVYIALSPDGQYGDRYYSGSGRMVSQTIKSELIGKLDNVIIAKQPEEYSKAVEFAASRKFDYLIYPTILHWEDRATEWSAKADRVKVKMTVVDVKAGQVIKSAVIEGKSGLATLGGDHPQDLLPEPTKAFFANML